MARYNKADISIETVALSRENFNVGDSVDVEVTVRNTKSSTSSESGYDAFFVLAESPQISEHIIAYCGIIQPGQTKTVDESGSMDPGTDGRLNIIEEQMEVAVVSGGHESGLNCTADNIATETPRDTAQISIDTTPTLAAREQVSLSIDSSSGGERTASLSYTVNSNSGDPTIVEVEANPGQKIDSIPISANGEQSRTVEWGFDNQQQIQEELCVDIISAEYA